jgi:hypothetical protein
MSSDESDEDLTTTLIRDLSNEDDWGLEGLPSGPAGYISSRQRPGGRSLLDELTAAEEEELGHAEGTLAATSSSSVQWGGSGGATGLDLEEQEAVLRRYFKPQQVKKLLQDQVEVDASYSEFRVRKPGRQMSTLGVNRNNNITISMNQGNPHDGMFVEWSALLTASCCFKHAHHVMMVAAALDKHALHTHHICQPLPIIALSPVISCHFLQ